MHFEALSTHVVQGLLQEGNVQVIPLRLYPVKHELHSRIEGPVQVAHFELHAEQAHQVSSIISFVSQSKYFPS